MSDRIYVATRKGVFTVDRDISNGDWAIVRSAFLAENCPMVLPDTRDGSVYAALDHGHFGTKLHRSSDAGETWQARQLRTVDSGAGPYPADYLSQRIAGTRRNWCARSGTSARSTTGWVVAPTFPARTRSSSIHATISTSRSMSRSAVSIVSEDLGATWTARGEGTRAEYMPPDQAFHPDAQDPHRLVQCPADPDSMWVQHHNGIFRSRDGGKSWTEIDDGRAVGQRESRRLLALRHGAPATDLRGSFRQMISS